MVVASTLPISWNILLLRRSSPLCRFLSLGSWRRTDTVTPTLVSMQSIRTAEVPAARTNPLLVDIMGPQVSPQVVGSNKELGAEIIRAFVLPVVQMSLDVRFAILFSFKELAADLVFARLLACFEPLANELFVAIRSCRCRLGPGITSWSGQVRFTDKLGNLLGLDVGFYPILFHVSVRQAHDAIDAHKGLCSLVGAHSPARRALSAASG